MYHLSGTQSNRASLHDHVGGMKAAYRLGYAGIKSLIILTVLALPQPPRQRSEPSLAIVAISVALCSFVYITLQGSDPGYLTDELLRKAVEAEEEEGHLLPTEEEEDDDDDGSSDNPNELKPHAQMKEKRHRVKRIQQIETQLRRSKGETNDDEIVEIDLKTFDLEAQSQQNGASVTIERFCVDCSLFPPIRSRHCRMCGRCVATFDHHCLFLGTCIGERNHSRFWWFTFFQSLELCFGILIVCARFHPPTAKSTWAQVNGWAIFVLCVLSLLLLLVGSLLGFHTFLAMTSMTTYEFGRSGSDKLPYLRGFRECDLPFSRGLFTNLAFFCCPQRLPKSAPPPSTHDSVTPPTKRHTHSDMVWRPMLWRPPMPIDRDSDKIWENLWENKYYSCC